MLEALLAAYLAPAALVLLVSWRLTRPRTAWGRALLVAFSFFWPVVAILAVFGR